MRSTILFDPHKCQPSEGLDLRHDASLRLSLGRMGAGETDLGWIGQRGKPGLEQGSKEKE